MTYNYPSCPYLLLRSGLRLLLPIQASVFWWLLVFFRQLSILIYVFLSSTKTTLNFPCPFTKLISYMPSFCKFFTSTGNILFATVFTSDQTSYSSSVNLLFLATLLRSLSTTCSVILCAYLFVKFSSFRQVPSFH